METNSFINMMTIPIMCIKPNVRVFSHQGFPLYTHRHIDFAIRLQDSLRGALQVNQATSHISIEKKGFGIDISIHILSPHFMIDSPLRFFIFIETNGDNINVDNIKYVFVLYIKKIYALKKNKTLLVLKLFFLFP